MTDEIAADERLYAEVDRSSDPAFLLRVMDATARWPAVRELRAWSRPRLTAGSSVLDVGCGLADVLLSLADDVPGCRLVGVDTSEQMVATARRRADEAGVVATFDQASATELPFDDGEFDATRTERVLQWLEEPQHAVDELARVTRPGGSVVVLDSDWRTFGSTVDQELERRVIGAPGPWPTRQAGGFLRHYLLVAGLRDVDWKVVVHATDRWAGDGSDGLFDDRVFAQGRVAAGVDPDDVERYMGEMRRQSEEGRLTLALTMWAATGRVPE
ncbi:MAG: methyltransferase domain-containing protein [Acidimicrobiia bacterium]|nr:methyltransferase domain-containing protein [Acidimicrobiia bacterium]